MNNSWLKKGLVVGIIGLFIGTGAGAAITEPLSASPPQPLDRGNWLYVGGTGPGNYTTIQSAINAANPGDTIFVYNGIYQETIVVNIPVTLIGEDRNTTILKFSGLGGSGMTIISNWVNVSGFKFQNCSKCGSGDAAIRIQSFDGKPSSHIFITGNTFVNNSKGIYAFFFACSDVVIRENVLIGCNGGICVTGTNVSIIGNYINYHWGDMYGKTGAGIVIDTRLSGNLNINISYNTITNYFPPGAGCGIVASIFSDNNITFYMNDITNCYIGMEVCVEESPNYSMNSGGDGKAAIIKRSNFRMNLISCFRYFENNNSKNKIFYQGNYWGRPRLVPKLIIILKRITEFIGIPSGLEFDLLPALKPYDIPKIAI